MRRIVLAGVVVAAIGSLISHTDAQLIEHTHPAANAVCLGSGSASTKCDLVWMNYSVESRKTASADDSYYANCPHATATKPECYQSYSDAKDSSSNWGTGATNALVPFTTAGPLTTGIYYGTGSADGRIFVGIRFDGAGSGAVAAGAGRNRTSDPYECVTLYGNDETPGHVIAGALSSTGISDDKTDYDTDGQVCGEYLRGVL